MDDTHALQPTMRRILRVKEGPAEEEREIVARLKHGESRALEELYARFGDALFRYLLTLVADRRLAEEVLQDTFVAAWRAAAAYRGDSSVKTWLFGIARRRTRDATRRREPAPVAEEAMAALADPELGPEEASMIAARKDELTACVGRLAPHHQEALALVFFHGLPYEEAAQVLGVPVGTVKSRLHGARKALRKTLRDREHGEKG